MKINYIRIRDALYDTLVADDKLNPASAATTYVNQVIKGAWMPRAPFPAILVRLVAKREHQMAIGYSPRFYLTGRLYVITKFNNEAATSALKTALGITTIDTLEKSDNELYTIVDEVEEYLRSDDSDQARRRLNITNITYALPGQVVFGITRSRDIWYNWAEMSVDMEGRLKP